MQHKKIKGSTITRLLSYVVSIYKLKSALVIIMILISSLASVVGSLFYEILIDDYIMPLMDVSHPVFTGLLKAVLIMGGIYLIGVVATWLYSRWMATIGQGVQKRIRDDLFSHMEELPINYFDTHAHGTIMSHYTNDIDALRQMISQSVPQTLAGAVTIISVILAMIFSSIPLTIVVFIVLCVMLFCSRLITAKSSRYFSQQQKDMGDVNGYIEEMMNGQKVIKVFNHEHVTLTDFDQVNDALFDSADNANKYANIMMPVMSAFLNLKYVIIAVVGCLMALGGNTAITIGLITSFLQLSKSLINPITQIAQQFNFIVMALAGAKRIFALMDEEPERDEGYVTLVNVAYVLGELTETEQQTNLWAWRHPHSDGTVTYTELTGDVRFEDVNFSYTSNKQILHDISLYAKPGEKLAFVGATGAGKTTITNLINRFYEIQEGKIRYDGINIQKIKKDSLRKSLGIVLQDTHLFTGTIMDNIRYGRLDATDAEVIAAAELANANNFIEELPDGYDTWIEGDGAALSQGQMQLLSIARVAVANPPVMILDEATSSIDTRTEELVQNGMDKLMKGRTVFVIAHRLSTIKNSNAIMVMDQGRIVERGDHRSLLQKCGVYYQLYTGALELD